MFLGNAYFWAVVAKGTPSILNDFMVDRIFSSGQLQWSFPANDYEPDSEEREQTQSLSKMQFRNYTDSLPSTAS
jgi:hypothetical protein